MSKKLTPKDTFGALVTDSGMFRKQKIHQMLGGDDGLAELCRHYKTVSVPRLDVATFGDFFTHCCQLNSILKKGKTIEITNKVGFDMSYQIVMKDRIGIRETNNGIPRGNARYANDHQIFGFLRPEHKELICKKERKAIFQDFYDLKVEVNQRLKTMRDGIMNLIDDEIEISDVYDVKYGMPDSNGYGMAHIGYVQMNHRIIPRDDMWIVVTCNEFNPDNGFDAVKDAYVWHKPYNEKAKRNDIQSITITIGFLDRSMQAGRDLQGQPCQIERVEKRTLLTSKITPNSYDSFKLQVHDHDFTGLDFANVHTTIISEYNAVSDWFDEELIRLRNKYSAEYTMWELVNGSDCAI